MTDEPVWGQEELRAPRMTRLLMSRDIGSVHMEIMLEVEDKVAQLDVSKLLRDCLAATESAIEEIEEQFFDEFAADQWRDDHGVRL